MTEQKQRQAEKEQKITGLYVQRNIQLESESYQRPALMP